MARRLQQLPTVSSALNAGSSTFSFQLLAVNGYDRLKRRGQFLSPRGLADMLDIDVAVKNDTLEFLWN